MMVKLHEFVTLAVDGPGQSDLHSGSVFIGGEKTPGIHSESYGEGSCMNYMSYMNCHRFYPLLLNKTNYRLLHFQ